MNQIIATAQQILDFKVGAISVGSVIQGLILLIIFNRIISMIMGPLIDKILDRFKLETTVSSTRFWTGLNWKPRCGAL